VLLSVHVALSLCVGLVALLQNLALALGLCGFANVPLKALANYSSLSGSAAILIYSSSSLVGYVAKMLIEVLHLTCLPAGRFNHISPHCGKRLLCGRHSTSVNHFIYSNLSRLVLMDILLSRSYNKRNSPLVLALILYCSSHTRKSNGKRLSALFLLFYVRRQGK